MKSQPIVIAFCLLLAGSVLSLNSASADTGKIYLDNTKTIYRLTGLWRFSRTDKLEYAAPEYDDSAWEWLAVPGHWNMLGIEDTEVAWYRYRFYLSPAFAELPIAIRVPAIADSHELYVNGKLVGGAGKIAADGSIIKKNSLPGVYYLKKELLHIKGENVIALRVADNVGWGGIATHDFYIGRAELLDLEFKKFVVWNTSIVIIIGFLGFYFLILYYGGSREKCFLYFSLFTTVVALMLFGYFSFPHALIDNYWFNLFVFHTGIHIAIIFGFLFVYSFYDYPPDLVFKLIVASCSLLFCVLLMTPLHHAILRFYGHVTLNMVMIIDALGFLYLLYMGIKSIILQKVGAKILGFGGLVIFSCFSNDIFSYMQLFENRRLGMEGTLVFMIINSFAMFLKFSRIKEGRP